MAVIQIPLVSNTMQKEILVKFGFCHCGCGEKTSICRKTSTRRGVVKGLPNNFIASHGMRGKPNNASRNAGVAHPKWKGGKIISQGYVWLRAPKHPYANGWGYVKRARIVLEKVGIFIPKGSMPHHIDNNKMNDCLKNLQVVTQSEHSKLTVKNMDLINPNWRKK